MTMNPLKLMGIPSLIMLFVVGIAWGMVPVNPARLRPQWRRGLVSFAGPGANLALALGFAGLLALYTVVCDFFPDAKAAEAGVNLFLQLGLRLNVLLAIFNLLPVPPLDGWDVFATIFPPLTRVNQEIRNGAMVILFMLMFTTDASLYVLQLPSYLTTQVTCSLLGVTPYWKTL
jgi:Zn-dependent protease